MATLPEASVSIDDEAGGLAGGTGYAVVIGCVEENDDITPRVFSSAKALLDQHGYSDAADYVAMHIGETRKPVIFVGLPKATAGTIGSEDDTGVSGTSVITLTAGANGVLGEVDGILTVTTGGTIGANGIVCTLSLDGGWTEKTIRLGTAATYTVPYLGIILNFAAGTLVAGDEYTFRTTAPMWDTAGLTAAKAALAAQTKLARSFVVIGDIPNSTFAGYVTTVINGYETADQRYALARVQVKDRLPLPLKSKVPTETLTFALATDTITRSAGSFTDDGFEVGDSVVVDGTVSNDGTHIITTILPLVITCSASTFVDETIDSEDVDMSVSQTKAAWMSALDSGFATVDAQKRIDLSAGRARKLSPITGWSFRRPIMWAFSIREYQRDIHITTWWKSLGPFDGWDLTDGEGNVVEYDERIDGGGLAARFSCARTWGNGPNGAFGAMSLTRATEGSLLSYTHNMHVANLACTVVQAETENAIGQVLVLKSDGTGSEESLLLIEGRVNSALQIALLQDNGFGPRASSAVWSASRSDILNTVAAELNGTLELRLNGTLERITTIVRVQTNG
jgi:hypothetical protein